MFNKKINYLSAAHYHNFIADDIRIGLKLPAIRPAIHDTAFSTTSPSVESLISYGGRSTRKFLYLY